MRNYRFPNVYTFMWPSPVGLSTGGLVVGKEGEGKFAIWDGKRKRLLHIPQEAVLLRAYLRKTDELLHWKTLALTGFARTKREAFFFDGKMWRHGAPGAIVFGWVIGRDLELESVGDISKLSTN